MFYSLTGKLIHEELGMVAISCGGVGYKCFVSLNTQKSLPKLGEDASVFTHLNVREDAMDLYAFSTQRELDFFKLLTNISGVGPKVCLAILSELTPDDVCMAAASGDNKAFSRANGVGPKLASRIVLELKDKVGGFMTSTETTVQRTNAKSSGMLNSTGAIQALLALGYTSQEANMAVSKIDPSLKTEDIIRMALKSLAQI